MRPKILFDLLLAHKNRGLSGIPQETRYLFLILSKSQKFETFGLLPNHNPSLKKLDLNNILNQSEYLLNLTNNPEKQPRNSSYIIKFFIKLANKLKKLKSLAKIYKTNFSLHELNKTFDSHITWRCFFDQMVNPTYSLEFMKCKFILSELDKVRRKIPFFQPKLKTQEYKFSIFQDLNYITCDETTIPIIRYHDGIPVLSPDLVPNKIHSINHYNEIKKVENKAIFVCNSTPSLEHLKAISPTAAENAVVIPCPVNQLQKTKTEPSEFFALAKLYISEFSQKLFPEVIKHWENHFSNNNYKGKYLLTLSNLEPKKNHCRLVDAWLKLRNDLKEDIKLIIIGSFGWDYESIATTISKHILEGNILHLEKIPENTKSMFFSFASCFVFPSIMEGFGIPPIEAQMCECPVIVSDIPALRYSCGDGASYFDPYNCDDICNKIKITLNLTQDHKTHLLQTALSNTKRFSQENILKQWEDFLTKQLSKSPHTP